MFGLTGYFRAGGSARQAALQLVHGMPRLLLFGGLLVVLIYYAIAVQRGADGHPAASQLDAFSYLQYARAFAEGHPYVFSPGDTPSTGSTSHLYPVLLAVPYLLGARGGALLHAAFVLNAICYLIWLQLFWRVARRVAPRQAVLAAGLVLLNGHLLLCMAGLTDMALFTVLAWGCFAALLYARFRLAALLLVLCVCARPEGVLLAVGLAAWGGYRAWRHDAQARRLLTIAACGLAASAAVFALNFALTGAAQFQSVAQKGYVKNFSLLGALGCAANDFGLLVREALFHMGAAPRGAMFLPVVGGLLAVAGVVAGMRPTRGVPVVGWWLGCSLATVGLIATSAWQGLGYDRYLLWLAPTWYLLAARGAGWLAEACHTPRIYPVLGVLLIGYELISWPYFAAMQAAQCTQVQSVGTIARAMDALLPPQAPVGVLSGPNAAYELGRRPIRHVAGITSPVFSRQRDMVCAVEMLKHQPTSRFTHLVITPAEQGWFAQAGLLGEPLLTNPDAPPNAQAFELYTARWEAFPVAALRPMDTNVCLAIAGLTLVDQLDVGYVPDEQRSRYRVGSRLSDQICHLCVASRRIGDQRITDVGQPVIGWDEFRVQGLRPGQPLRIVMRTTLDATCAIMRVTENRIGEGVHLRAPLQIRPLVNNHTLPLVSLPVNDDPDRFTETYFDIPGEEVTSDALSIALAGDHIAMFYWFFQ